MPRLPKNWLIVSVLLGLVIISAGFVTFRSNQRIADFMAKFNLFDKETTSSSSATVARQANFSGCVQAIIDKYMTQAEKECLAQKKVQFSVCVDNAKIKFNEDSEVTTEIERCFKLYPSKP